MKKILFFAFILCSSVTVAFSQCITNAGPDITICGDEEVGLGGIIPSGASATWAGGVGTFDPNRNDPLAIYTPDASEVGNPVSLILNSSGGACPNGSDTMTIFVNNTPDLYNLDGFVSNVCPSVTVDLSSVNIVDSNNAGGTYTYEDAAFNTLASPIVSTNGIYYVRRTTNSQPPCEDFVSVAVIILPCGGGGCSNQPSLSDNSFDVTCNGDGDGSVDITLSGGVPPVSYSWSNGETTEDISNLNGGVYTVTVTDNEGCTSELTTTVDEPGALDATIWSNGGLTFCRFPPSGILMQSTPDPTVTKQWLRFGVPIAGATGDTYYGTDAVGYKLKVTNANGCELVGNKLTLSKYPNPPTDVIVSGPSAFCGGDSSLIETTVGAPYTIEWLRYGNPQSGATGNQYYVSRTGNYKLSVTDTNGCIARSQKYVYNRLQRPLASQTPTTANVPGPVCDGDSVLLTASVSGGTAPFTYQWIRYSSNIAGATNSTYVSTNFGAYRFRVEDVNGCSSKSVKTFIYETCRLGDQSYDLSDKLHLAAYPNPFNHQLTLALDNFSDEKVSIMIRDAVGRLVYNTEDIAKFNYSINTSNFNSGMFIVELHQGNEMQRVKIMKND
ncbi:MAG: T9SS type A sorting domain-containing protein [Bacteroidia bacterium]|nr:T9SS type A sorting domain-containing protein [Bacteroidia bacterium]